MKNEAVQKNISPDELKRRVATIKRFRELLSQQRDRFRQYLTVLDKQKDVIEKGNADALMAHVELEEQIIGDIFAIQKVIDPMEAMYRASFPTGPAGILPAGAFSGEAQGIPAEAQSEVPGLRTALEELRLEAVLRSTRNRELLASRMEEIRQEMKALRANPYAIHHSAYSSESAALVDIAG
ncbi:MAG: flagellar protein FlgN [Spirochaetaceae bacterium]|nr:flagellar protein FlgN [Spirochaetaceae bacterium]